MNADLDSLVILFLAASVFLILLFIIAISLPRLLKKKEAKTESVEVNSVVNAFRAFGDEIRSLREQLVIKERLALLGEISAGIAHEFRNPMGVIAGYARLLLNSLDEDDKRREIVQNIIKEISQLNLTMEELLKFSRSDPIRKADTNLMSSIKDVIQGMGEHRERIELSSIEDLIIKADEPLIKQTIRNLIHNAIDAGERVWINIERGVHLGKEGVFIEIKDNGRGIPAGDLDKVFMPFYTTKDRGLGIGLALVQRIVLGHGGSISVESIEGRGSTFRVFLPSE